MLSRLIVNPRAGRDAAGAAVAAINDRIRRGGADLDIVLTTAAGDAEHAARQAAEAGYRQLYVAGGDGTLNEVVNGVAAVEGALAETVFCVIPFGTGNDFARTLGIPLDFPDSLDATLDGRVRNADLGVLNGRVFVNTSAGGFVAEVSEEVDEDLKSIAGRLAYLVGGARVLTRYEPVRARYSYGREPAVSGEIALQMFVVCNAPTFGGGSLIAPHARLDDGLLDVCVIPAMPVPRFVALLGRIPSGAHLEDDLVHYRQVPAFDLEFEEPTKVNTDGETLEARRCTYRSISGAGRFMVPGSDVPG